jgi:hypothetical protein
MASEKYINEFQRSYDGICGDFQKFERECSRRIGNIEEREKQIQEKPLNAFEEALLYLDSGDTALSDEAYKAHPKLIAENIVKAGTKLIDGALEQSKSSSRRASALRGSNEGQALYKLAEKFSGIRFSPDVPHTGIPTEFKTTENGRTFLGKLQEYCQARVACLTSGMDRANQIIKIKEDRIKLREDEIKKLKEEQSTLGGKVANFFSKESADKLGKLEAEIKTLKEEIGKIKKETAEALSPPECTFLELNQEVRVLNKVIGNIDSALPPTAKK